MQKIYKLGQATVISEVKSSYNKFVDGVSDSEKNANSSVGDIHCLEDGVRCLRSDICSIMGEAYGTRSDVCPKLRDEATVVYI